MKQPIKNWSQMANWGHYNRKYINAIMKKKELFEIRIGVCSLDHTKGADRFTWSGISGNTSFDYLTSARVHYTGPISLSGGYSFITLQYEDFVFNLEFVSSAAGFVYKLSPVTLSRLYRFTIGFYAGSQGKEAVGSVMMGDRFCELRNHASGTHCKAYVLSSSWTYDGNTAEVDGRETVYITDIPNICTDFLEQLLSEGKAREAADAIRGNGDLGGETVLSMIRAAGWNKVYDHVNDAFQIDVSRLWAPESCYYSFYWDNLLDSLPVALQHKESAYDQFESICSEFKNGRLPQCSWEWGSSGMINPPIGSYCLLKVYQQYREKELLELYFRYFYETNRVLFAQKSDGVIGLISLLGPEEKDQSLKVSQTNAAMASALATGLDNSPMYDEKENFIDVGMSSIYALDCLCLSLIAKELGDTERYDQIHLAYLSAKDAINEYLWDEENGIYCNRGMDGTLKTVYSPTSFYPLLACDVPPERRMRLIHEHLMNEDEFWGEYVIPSIDKRHPSFLKQDYWEGCAWAPMNFLVYEGLRNSSEHKAASMLAQKSVAMYRYNWDNFGWVLENYNTLTGSITPNCVPMYTWGTLLAYLGVQELIRPCIDGIEFGNLSGEAQGIENVRIGGRRVAVQAKQGILIEADGQLLIKTDIPAIIRFDPAEMEKWQIETDTDGAAVTASGEQIPLHTGVNCFTSAIASALFSSSVDRAVKEAL